MVIIGIVGSPSGGKSTVASRLRELGATWVNADRLAHRCLRWPAVERQLVDYFGGEIRHAAGGLERSALAARVFGDDAESLRGLNYLQSVIHPYTRHLALRRLTRATRCGLPAAVLDAPLLLEADWGILCDFVWCIDAPRPLRESWIRARGWSVQQLRQREQRQLAIAEKRRLATHVIDNDRDLSHLIEQTDLYWSAIQQSQHRSWPPVADLPPPHSAHSRSQRSQTESIGEAAAIGTEQGGTDETRSASRSGDGCVDRPDVTPADGEARGETATAGRGSTDRSRVKARLSHPLPESTRMPVLDHCTAYPTTRPSELPAGDRPDRDSLFSSN